ncbi:MAG: SUMF1/EgtB/PvdO family nonheme iron enzyme, partial [Thermoguttaceae bacterium]|nr:SUMF1/EgtB/PvdO family nonheme iron enzyme [Thermoguttaceae bacterium]
MKLTTKNLLAATFASTLSVALCVALCVASGDCGLSNNVANAADASSVDWDDAPEAGTLKTVTVDGIDYNFRYCPAGSFKTGSPEDEEGRGELEDRRDVTFSKGFWTLETEVTVEMFRSFVKATGHKTGTYEFGDDGEYTWENLPLTGAAPTDAAPVTLVSHRDAVAFCKWLSKEAGTKISLPTETEWEYACRAGTKGAYNYVGSVTTTDVETQRELKRKKIKDFNYGSSVPFGPGEKEEEFSRRTYTQGRYRVTEITRKVKKPRLDNLLDDEVAYWAEVKKFRSNTWHIYEMHGNVREWCSGTYTLLELVGEPRGDADDEVNEKQSRVAPVRGGSWASHVDDCRSASRDFLGPDSRDPFTGFRCVAGGEGSDAVEASSSPESEEPSVSDEIALGEDNATSPQEPETDVDAAPQSSVSDENSDVAWDAAPNAGTLKTLNVDGIAYKFRYCP